MKRRALNGSLVALAVAMTLAPSVTRAQSGVWPNNKPIRLVVGFPPGGLTDAYARQYGDHLSQKLGVPVVVENKPGAGAMLAIDAVAKSAPDGHTLLVTTSGTVWQNRVLYSKLPYNLDKDLTPVVVFPSGPLVMGVNERLPVRNLNELIEWAKRTPAPWGLMPRALIRTWWPIRWGANTDFRCKPSITGARHRCGSMWCLASCKWRSAVSSRSMRSPAVVSERSASRVIPLAASARGADPDRAG
jgi:hypothetical protein